MLDEGPPAGIFSDRKWGRGVVRIEPGEGIVYGGAMDWDFEVDCAGLLCPLPVLRARKRLLAMAAGQVLCVRATDPMAAVDLPHYCGQAGHQYFGARDESGVTLHLIRRG